MGIRMALGAAPGQVLLWVVGRGLKVLGVSAVAGLGGAVLLGSLLSRAFREVEPLHPGIWLVTTLTLTAVAFVACFLPARAASRVDPAAVLRSE